MKLVTGGTVRSGMHRTVISRENEESKSRKHCEGGADATGNAVLEQHIRAFGR